MIFRQIICLQIKPSLKQERERGKNKKIKIKIKEKGNALLHIRLNMAKRLNRLITTNQDKQWERSEEGGR